MVAGSAKRQARTESPPSVEYVSIKSSQIYSALLFKTDSPKSESSAIVILEVIYDNFGLTCRPEEFLAGRISHFSSTFIEIG